MTTPTLKQHFYRLAAASGIACLTILGWARPAAAREAPVTTLLRQQTERFADVSQRGDQTAMGKMLNAEVLFSGGSGSVDTQNPDHKHDQDDRVSALLKRKTLAFLTSSVRADGTASPEPVSVESLIVTEDGYVSNHRDIPSGTSTDLLKSLAPTIAISQWMMHDLGDAAVTSYVESQVLHLGAQRPTYQSLFVDVWIDRQGAWTIVSSHRIALHQDPPTFPITASGLDEYLGDYAAAPGVRVKITRVGTGLVSSVNGGPPAALLAEARDVFFRSGVPAGYPRPQTIFRRDASGRVTGYVSRAPGLGNLVFAKSGAGTQPDASSASAAAIPHGLLTLRDFIVHQFGDVAVTTFRHDRETKIGPQDVRTTYRSSEAWIKRGNGWTMISSQGCEIQPDPPAISPAPDILNDEAGTYRAGPKFSVTIKRNETGLTASINDGAEVFSLVAQSREVFFTPGSPLESFIFQRDADGKVTSCVERYAERDLMLTKV